MQSKDVVKLWEDRKGQLGPKPYRYISSILEEAKEIHRQGFKGRDFEQSWKGIKGNALEGIISSLVRSEVERIGLIVVAGNKLERTKPANLSTALKRVKKNLSIDFGEYGFHIPDADLVIYNPDTYKVVAVLSAKVTLRERIAQTAYWYLKIKNYELTEEIQVYFLTPDEDGTLTSKYPPRKSRAIVETDTDGSYILSMQEIEESNKVKTFDKFISDLRKLIS